MNGQLISITTSDKSVMVHITGQEDANTHGLTTPGHIRSSSCEVLSAVTCCVLKWQGLRVGSLINYQKTSSCVEIIAFLTLLSSEWRLQTWKLSQYEK